MEHTLRSIVVAVAIGALLATTAPEAFANADSVAQTNDSETPVAAVDHDAPNIIVFMTDDQTVEQMSGLALTTELLVDGGVTFTQSVVNLASCCPSRATFLTGQHAGNHGVVTNSGRSGGADSFENEDTALPVALQNAGYDTVFVGKYLNGYGFIRRYTPPGWTDFRGLISPTEVLYHSPSFWIDDEMVSFGVDDYATDVINDFTLEAIDEAGDDNPIFAWVSYPAPHAEAGQPLTTLDRELLFREARHTTDDVYLRPPGVAPRHQGLIDEGLPPTPNLNEADISDKPEFLARKVRLFTGLESAEVFHSAQLGSLLAVDESVAAIVERMQQSDRDTWFIFTSDNGLLVGAHRHFGAKYFPYEENTRVPLIIAGPGVEPGTTNPMMSSNVDLTPTILDLANATALREPDGISLVPYATGEIEPHGRAVLLEGYEWRPKVPPFVGVHTGSSVYVEWFNGDRELYDLTADPYQLENLYGVDGTRRLLGRNRALLRQLESCEGEPCRTIGAALPDPIPPTR